MAGKILGSGSSEDPIKFRDETQRRYLTTMAQEVSPSHPLTETELFRSIHERYGRSLKENVLDPFIQSENFRRAVGDFMTDAFHSYDHRVQNEVAALMRNLGSNFRYSPKTAKEICQYVIDKKLVEAFK